MHVVDGFSLRKIRSIGLRTLVAVALVAGFVEAVTSTPAQALGPNAIRTFSGMSTLAANDDGSTVAVPLGFPINYYGAQYSSVYVNNNGNLTFDGPLAEYTPSGLVGPAMKIIAPFFADVDTRGEGSNLVTYGQATVDGHPAFAATWPGVGCYAENDSVLDYFQVVIIDRSDTGSENFDIEFNYDQVQWDAGQASGGNEHCTGSTAPAHIGYSNGVASDSYELPGSGVNGAFLDGGPDALVSHDVNSSQLGRYLFSIRTVATTTTGTLADDTNAGATLETIVGTPVTDSAVLSGQTATAGGTMTYAVYPSADCSGSPAATSVRTVSNGAVAASDPFSLPVGTYRVVATYSGDSHNRGSATACGDQVLTVNPPRPLTITAQDRSITYGAPDPAFGYTVAGLVGTDELTTAPTCGVAGPHAAAGTYAITCSGADAGADYAISYQPGTLSVGQAAIQISADDESTTYGAGDPDFGYRVTGLLGSDRLTTPPTCGVTGNHAAAGTYAITCSGADAGADYAISYQPGTLSVGQAAIQISADDESTTYGAGDPDFGYRVTGLLGSDRLTTPPTCGVTGNHADAGTYPVTCSGADAGGNYRISYSGATLTVAPKQITVTADNHGAVYGAGDPTFTSTVTGLVGSDTLATGATCGVDGAHRMAGTYTITCSGADAGSNYTIRYASGTYTVAKAPLTVNAPSPATTYGIAAAGISFVPSIDGLVYDDTPSSASVDDVTCGTTAAVTAGGSYPAGAYPVTCTGPDATANYIVSYEAGTLTVAKATVTFTAASLTRQYGSSNPPLTATASGFVNGDTAATAYSGAPSVSTAATAASDTGDYPITVAAGTLSSANYRFAFVPGVLTITQEPTTLDAQSVPVGIGPGGLRLQVGSLSATLRAGSGNEPVAGQPVVFSVGSTRLCTANTDANGVATCAITVAQQLLVVLNLGFTASFAGSRNLLSSTDHAGLIGPA